VPDRSETVTVTCSRHGLPCLLADPLKGGGIRLRHDGPGAFGSAVCDSQRFTVRHELEQETTREGAHAELIRLDLIRQAQDAVLAKVAQEPQPAEDTSDEDDDPAEAEAPRYVLKARPATTPECEPHTPTPTGYIAESNWADDMMDKGWTQRQCRGCGLWMIWEAPQ
jgi:hypothetical protein